MRADRRLAHPRRRSRDRRRLDYGTEPVPSRMAIAALEAGKHIWCEKPMASSLADAERMLAAARASGRAAVLGYNYIQNPAIRLMRRILEEGQIGEVNHVRMEMDEDFMADPEALFYWKSEASSGHGALDDFGVHPLSLLKVLLGRVRRVCGHMAKPYADRPLAGGGRRPVETYDIATTLLEMESGATGLIALNRSAWGRKGRIFVQIFGSKGTLAYDQERMNEVQLYTADRRQGIPGFSDDPDGAAPPALRQVHPGARPPARLQRPQGDRVSRAHRADPRRAGGCHRLRGRHPHRAHGRCHRPQCPFRDMGGSRARRGTARSLGRAAHQGACSRTTVMKIVA